MFEKRYLNSSSKGIVKIVLFNLVGPTFPGQLDLFLRDPGTFSTLPLGEEPLAEWQLWMTYSLKNLAMELHC